MDSVFLTDIGMKRKQNQDSGIVRPDLGLYIIADGMGGHQGGETASQLTVHKITEHFNNHINQKCSDSELLLQGLQIANQSVFEEARQNPSLEGMGTTATLLKISQNKATILQVGDSRAYFFNEHGLWQITRDHSLVQEKLQAKLITRAQLKTDSMKNVITRSVGYDLNLKADLYTLNFQAGDGFLLCSDGLTGPVDDQKIFDILDEMRTLGLDLKSACQKLIDAANAGGGDDNVSVILVQTKK